MERVVIKQDHRIDNFLNFFFAFFTAFGGLMLIVLMYDFFTGQLEESWIMSFMFGVVYFVGGLGYLSGFFKPNEAKLIVDEKGIHSTDTHWEQSFKWDKLKNVSLNKKGIQIQYSETGLSDSIKLPFMLRWGNMKKLENTLSNACKINNIDLG